MYISQSLYTKMWTEFSANKFMSHAVWRLSNRVWDILLMALKVALSGNVWMKSLPSSILVLSRGSKGTAPERERKWSWLQIQAEPINITPDKWSSATLCLEKKTQLMYKLIGINIENEVDVKGHVWSDTHLAQSMQCSHTQLLSQCHGPSWISCIITQEIDQHTKRFTAEGKRLMIWSFEPRIIDDHVLRCHWGFF